MTRGGPEVERICPKPAAPTVFPGMANGVRLKALNISQRNCTLYRSWNGKFFPIPISKLLTPGPTNRLREKMSRRTPQPSFTTILSGGHTRSPVSTNPVGECNTIRNRWFGERLLDFLAERRFADVFNVQFPLPTIRILIMFAGTWL